MWVVKLGGSLSRDRRLLAWLRMLADFGGGRVAVVPGGAGFADAVRKAQSHWGFGDLAAHNMATLAMAQTAMLLQALEPRLVPARHDAEIRGALRAGRAAVWVPFEALRDAPDELTSWDVTSDSLALWLARRLHAERLMVVKSCPIDRSRTLGELAAAGVLDARFAGWAAQACFPIEVLASHEVERMRDALIGGVALQS